MTLSPEIKTAFNQMLDDIETGRSIGLMEAKHKATGEVHALVVFFDDVPDGTVDITGVARFLPGNLGVDEYLPPEEAGGFGLADILEVKRVPERTIETDLEEDR